MKSNFPVALTCVSILLAGCSEDFSQAKSPNATTAMTNSNTHTRPATSEEARPTTESLVVKRRAIEDAMVLTLDQWEIKLDELREQTGALGEDARATSAKYVATLREQYQEAGRCLTELQASGMEQWTNVQTRFQAAVTQMDHTYEELKSQFD